MMEFAAAHTALLTWSPLCHGNLVSIASRTSEEARMMGVCT